MTTCSLADDKSYKIKTDTEHHVKTNQLDLSPIVAKLQEDPSSDGSGDLSLCFRQCRRCVAAWRCMLSSLLFLYFQSA